MIDLYYWTTPNGHKLTIFLEETGLPYMLKPINISRGDQFDPAFLAISPNNRIPAIVDHAPADGGGPLAMFESGAILLYLADKVGRLIPAALRARLDCIQWLFWQMGNLGPMAGQNHHFRIYAPEKLPYAMTRYLKETGRLYAVLNKRLAERAFIVNDYSIADIASYPWVQPERQGQDINEFPNLKRWKEAIAARPAVQRAYASAKTVNMKPAVSDEQSRKVLFGQDQSVVKSPDPISRRPLCGGSVRRARDRKRLSIRRIATRELLIGTLGIGELLRPLRQRFVRGFPLVHGLRRRGFRRRVGTGFRLPRAFFRVEQCLAVGQRRRTRDGIGRRLTDVGCRNAVRRIAAYKPLPRREFIGERCVRRSRGLCGRERRRGRERDRDQCAKQRFSG
jgi:GST-like protein